MVVINREWGKVLGIESSCDETAAAVYCPARKAMLSSVLYSQIAIHKEFGGVVPELASRSHLMKIGDVVRQALSHADSSLDDMACIAVTTKPGLPGSLLVGLSFAKALSFALKKKLIGVDHIEGHIFSAHIEHDVPFPYLALTASGGHTSLYVVHDFGSFELLGTTHDDAAGETLDKIATLIGLPYPGGPWIEKVATAQGYIQDYFHYPRPLPHSLEFSFSGLKTAIFYDLVKRGVCRIDKKQSVSIAGTPLQKEIASSLLVAIADIFEQKLQLAHHNNPAIRAVAFVGGVACNKYIRARLLDFCTQRGLQLFVPSPQYCTDNGAMIAFVGAYRAQKGLFADYTLDIL